MFNAAKHVSTKLFLIGFVLPAVAFLGTIGFSGYLAVQANIDEIQLLNEVAARDVAREVDEFLLQEARVLETLAYSPLIRDYLQSLDGAEDHTDSPLYDSVRGYLLEIDEVDEELDILYIGSPYQPGIITSDEVQLTDGYDGRERQWYQRALESGGMGVTDAYESAVVDDDSTNDVIVSLSWAVRDADGNVLGVISLNYNFAKIAEVVQREFDAGQFVSLFDMRTEDLLMNQDHSAAAGLSLDDVLDELGYSAEENQLFRETIDQVRNSNEGTLYRGTRYVSVYPLETAPWIVTSSYDFGEVSRREAIRESGFLAPFVVVFLIILLGGIFLTLRSVVRPLKALSANLEDLATGDADLTRTLSVASSDEIGALATNFNTFLAKLNELVSDVRHSVEGTTTIKTNIVSSTEETSSSLEEISATLNSVAKQMQTLDQSTATTTTSIEQITASISSINERISSQASMVEKSTAAITEMTASLDSVNGITKAKREGTEQLRAVSQDGISQLHETSQAFNEAVEQIANISQMADTITAIAAQTNLLSMNAAIEAAHAGDEGRGFAVVAEEIRKLADSAATSSQQISAIIKKVTTTISSTDEHIKGTVKAFESVEQEIGSTIDAFSEIESSVSEITVGSKETLEASQQISAITSELNTSSNEIDQGAQTVLREAAEVKEISSQATAAMVETQTGAEEITRAMQMLVSLSGELSEIIDGLNEKFGRFTVD